MHHFNSINALEMLTIKSIDGPDISLSGKRDNPCIDEIYIFFAIHRDSIGDHISIADINTVRMNDCIQERYDLTAFEFIKALKYPDKLRDHN